MLLMSPAHCGCLLRVPCAVQSSNCVGAHWVVGTPHGIFFRRKLVGVTDIWAAGTPGGNAREEQHRRKQERKRFCDVRRALPPGTIGPRHVLPLSVTQKRFWLYPNLSVFYYCLQLLMIVYEPKPRRKTPRGGYKRCFGVSRLPLPPWPSGWALATGGPVVSTRGEPMHLEPLGGSQGGGAA